MDEEVYLHGNHQEEVIEIGQENRGTKVWE